MPAKSRFAGFFTTYGDAVKAQCEMRSAAANEVASFNWTKGAALDAAVRSDGGEGAVPRILEEFHDHFGDDATTQHARLCLNAFRAFPTEESRVGHSWTACAVLVAPVRRLLIKAGDEDPAPEAVGSHARTRFLEQEGLATVAELKAAVKAALGEPTVTRKQRIGIAKVRNAVRDFLKTARPRDLEALRAFMAETLKATEPAATGPVSAIA